jgi:hypothetical protein
MSIIQTPVTNPVFLPVSQNKAFAASNLEAIINGKVSLSDSERVTPSFIRMDKASAISAMGGKATPVSFVTGLLFNLAAFAEGQGNLAGLVAGLPPLAVFAVTHGAGLLAIGKGTTAKGLKDATLSAMHAVMALPAKPAKAKPAKIEEKPAIDGECSTVETSPDAEWQAMTGQAREQARAMLRIAGERAQAKAEQAEQVAGLVAERVRAEEASGPSMLDLFAVLAKNQPEQARAMLESMAGLMGLSLIDPAMQQAEEASIAVAKPAKARAKVKPVKVA